MDDMSIVTAGLGVANQSETPTQKTADGTVVQGSAQAFSDKMATELKAIESAITSPEVRQKVGDILNQITQSPGVKSDPEKFYNYLKEVAAKDIANIDAHLESLQTYVQQGGSIDKYVETTNAIAAAYKAATNSGSSIPTDAQLTKAVSESFGTYLNQQPIFPFDRSFLDVYIEYLKRLASGADLAVKYASEQAFNAITAKAPSTPQEAVLPVVDTIA